MSDWRQESENRKRAIREFMEANEIKVTAEFVPFSSSRNANKTVKNGKLVPLAKVHTSDKSLNWNVSLHIRGRQFLETAYTAGIGHCPSYKQSAKWTMSYTDIIDFECEFGHTAKTPSYGGIYKGAAIQPDSLDVLYSIVSDSDVIDYATFEEWAENLGYETDSRAAERIYRDCLEIALRFRNGLGESIIAQLRELFQDY